MAKRKMRRRNRLMLFAAEGNNETEKLYLRDLVIDTNGLSIKKAYGNNTDPVGMVKSLIDTMHDLDFDSEYGDIAFCFLDLDLDRNKEKQVKEEETLATNHNIHIIVSNPCFELWYICHFTGSPKNYRSSKDLLKEMSRYIKGYSKSKEGIYAITKPYIPTAIKNAEILERRAMAN